VNMMEISNEVPEHPVRIALYSPDKADLKITQITTSNPAYISATTEPLTERDRKQLGAPGGYRVNIVIKSGLPLGSFHEEVVFQLDHPEKPEHRIDLTGRVVGPILAIPERLRQYHFRSRVGAR